MFGLQHRRKWRFLAARRPRQLPRIPKDQNATAENAKRTDEGGSNDSFEGRDKVEREGREGRDKVEREGREENILSHRPTHPLPCGFKTAFLTEEPPPHFDHLPSKGFKVSSTSHASFTTGRPPHRLHACA
ncbi:hypothetical protein EVAR_86819_1 [Eumeta japonica]|uniref:Uncharacterized protein n=1 Tax=Eumeta variegata TaxID=151549 RepID=A0A4C1VUJ9_EUMVA|nr:hypothetical protein EVAR_86819_1 [Eumeta japonica]